MKLVKCASAFFHFRTRDASMTTAELRTLVAASAWRPIARRSFMPYLTFDQLVCGGPFRDKLITRTSDSADGQAAAPLIDDAEASRRPETGMGCWHILDA